MGRKWLLHRVRDLSFRDSETRVPYIPKAIALYICLSELRNLQYTPFSGKLSGDRANHPFPSQ